METFGYQKKTMDTNEHPKFANKYSCSLCEYKTNHRSHYNTHLLSKRHLKWKHLDTNTAETAETAISSIKIYSCEFCDKTYCNRSGLWKHKKKCNQSIENNMIQTIVEQQQTIMNELIDIKQQNTDIKKENTELKQLLQTQNQIIVSNNNNNNQLANPQPTSASTHITGDHNNIQNNIFNTQVFLENECKNAVNIDDIIEKVIIDVDKLDVFKEKGTSIGIANILNEVLKSYNIYERPIHCSDVKRLSMHVKDNDIWLSKQQGQEKLSKTIYYIQQSAMKQIYDWEAYYKHKMNPDNLDKGMNLLIKRTTNSLTEDDNKKIIKTIAPNVKLGGETDVKGTDGSLLNPP